MASAPFSVGRSVQPTRSSVAQPARSSSVANLVFSERDHHRRRHAGNTAQIVMNAKLAPALIALLLEPLQMLAGTRLNFFCRVLVEAFDAGDFAQLDVGHFLNRREAFGREKLGNDFVNVERVHERLAALKEFLLAALALFVLGQNVDVPARQLRSKPDVLAAPTDRERELRLGNDNLDATRVLVENDLGDLGRSKRVDEEARLILDPLDDVDLSRPEAR
jgi:hypothetical protein